MSYIGSSARPGDLYDEDDRHEDLRHRIEREWTLTDATGLEGQLVYVVARLGVEDLVIDSRKFNRSVAVSYRLGRIEETLKAERH